MRTMKRMALSFLLLTSSITALTPTGVAVALPGYTEASLVAQRAKLGTWIWKAGKQIFITGAGAIVGATTSRGTARAMEAHRAQQLAEKVHLEQYTYYSMYGTPIPIDERHLALLMNRVGALPSERDYVSSRMHLYW